MWSESPIFHQSRKNSQVSHSTLGLNHPSIRLWHEDTNAAEKWLVQKSYFPYFRYESKQMANPLVSELLTILQ